MLSELSHLQEVLEQLEKHTADPHILPAASEQVTITKMILFYICFKLIILFILSLNRYKFLAQNHNMSQKTNLYLKNKRKYSCIMNPPIS